MLASHHEFFKYFNNGYPEANKEKADKYNDYVECFIEGLNLH